MKQKFKQGEVLDLFNWCDILIIEETHFNIIAKCPEGFVLIARSKASGDKLYRGGVAVYVKICGEVKAEVISKDFLDCIILDLNRLDVIRVAYHSRLFYKP